MVRHPYLVRVFEYEPDLLRHLGRLDAEAASARTVVEAVSLETGEELSAALPSEPTDLGFLVLDGMLARNVEAFGHRAVELLGAGDFIRPRGASQLPPPAAVVGDCRALTPARVGLLDRRFEREASMLPGVLAELADRTAARATSLCVQLAIAQLPQLEARLLALFWTAAERWGIVEARGVSVHLPVSQSLLAELTSSRRPSVNSALRRLRDRGDLIASPDGHWLLVGQQPRCEVLSAPTVSGMTVGARGE